MGLFWILLLSFSLLGLDAQEPIIYPSILDSKEAELAKRRLDLPREKNSPSPGIAALLGIFPGIGHLYLGDYNTAAVQMGMYFGLSAMSSHFSSQKDYISWDDRNVTFKYEDVLLGYTYQKRGFAYSNSFYLYPAMDNVGIVETQFERDIRLYREGKLAEQNTFLKYGDYSRTNHSTYYSDQLSNPMLSMSLYSIYSAYRDAGGLGDYKKSESISDLAIAPFDPKILKESYVYIPMIFFTILAASDRLSPDGSNPILAPRRLINDGSLYAGAFVSGISPAIGEEAFFRGYLNHRLSLSGLGPYGGLGTSSVLFMLAHEGNDDARDGRLARLLGGAYLGYIHLIYGYDLRPSIAVHFWWNFILGVSQISSYIADPNYDKSQREVFFMPISYTINIQ